MWLMETEKCKALLLTLQKGSITATAEELGYTTSGVSRMLASLEEETGLSLLIRSRNGVAPTTECAALLPIMRELVHHAERLTQKTAAIKGLEEGTVTMGIAYGIYFRWLGKLMNSFRLLHPHINFRILQGASTELNQALEEHQVDFCLISRRSLQHQWIQLRHDELLLILPPQHPLTKLDTIPPQSISDESYIELYPDKETDNSRFLAENKIKPSKRISCSDDFSAMAMVEAGLGITLMNAILTKSFHGKIAKRSLEPKEFIDIGIAIPDKNILSPAAQKFLEYLQRQL